MQIPPLPDRLPDLATVTAPCLTWIPSPRRCNSERGRPAARRGPPARRSVDDRGSAVSLPDPLRGPRRVQHDRVAEAGHGGVGAGRRHQLRRASDAPAALQDFRDAGARSHRRAARHLVQSAVSRRRLSSPSAGRALRQARAVVARAADAEPAVRAGADRRRRRGGDGRGARRRGRGAHRPDRADLREDRHAHHQDSAGDGVPGAGAAAAGAARPAAARRPARAPA